MTHEIDKEEFLKEIHTIPDWVRNGDDLLKFCKHLQYRLIQSRAVSDWYANHWNLYNEECIDPSKIYSAYDKIYNNDRSEFQPFAEFLVEAEKVIQ